MKKLILFAAMAAIAVSCAKTSEVKSVSEQAIGFETWTSNLTKSTHSAFISGATFNVYGYKHMGDESTHTDVFTGDVVTYNGTAWNYSTIRFWDRTTNFYNFFAISPAGLVSSFLNDNPGCFVTNDITFTGKYGDVLIAKKCTVEKTNYGLAVGLVFVPQAALFDLKVKKAKNLEEAELIINSVSLKNIQTKGHLSVSEYDGTGIPTATWTLASPAAPANFNNTHGVVAVNPLPTIGAGVGYGTSNSVYLINNLIVMPQVLNLSQQLEINYTINFSGESITHTRTIDLNKFDLTDMQGEGRAESDQNTAPFVESWTPGKHYTYYLTINADLIVFSATISDWTDVNAYHYIIN